MMPVVRVLQIMLFSAFVLAGRGDLRAQEKAGATAEELAKKLSNPIASLISLPTQANFDAGIGAFNGSKLVVNVQPVIPITMSPKLNLITRWILPIVSQFDVTGESTDQAGLGDAVITGFLSPSGGGITWGIGPAFMLPTATDDVLGSGKFSIGPSIVVLKQSGPWTYGALANHLFSVAGDDERSDVSATFVNPFLAHNWKSGAGVTVTAEYTRDWENEVSVLVFHTLLSAVTKVGGQTVSLAMGPRFHFEPDNHASYGLRSAITLVFPK